MKITQKCTKTTGLQMNICYTILNNHKSTQSFQNFEVLKICFDTINTTRDANFFYFHTNMNAG